MTRSEDWGLTEVAISEEPGWAVAAGIEFRVTSGPDAKLARAFEGERFGIGTAEGNSLVLRDSSVSRFHCEILRGPQGILLKDLDSTNGTFLDGYRVREVFLRPGARLRLGKTEVRCVERGTIRMPVSTRSSFGELVGQSVAMRRLFDLLEKLSQSDVSVLVEGETGTGKELVARALHAASARSDGPYQIVDSGSLPPGLVESELFGHEKGAFTGATTTRVGAFEAASGGTLLIDELGELPVELQPKLLRILETRQVRRLGSTQARNVDVRFLAATNRDLRREVNRKTFRSDLYFRIAQVTVHLPPLRERPEDIPGLVERFLDDLRARSPHGRRLHISVEKIEEMKGYAWPGNVRELRNHLERAAALTVDGVVDASLPGAVTSEPAAAIQAPFGIAKAAAIETFERSYLAALIERTGGNVSQAAREAQVDRAHLVGLLRKYGLR
ncbi:MAG: sigma 54-dependent Fis family transcriptional regulator [Deltaproteobacteria bacterium]|nr:sigma 54-dependent Fis family transcriptional regulator [Deltaproteobacteria bacterium]